MIFGERFLARPDLFPARAGGEAWGDRRLELRVAGMRLQVEGLAAEQVEAARARFGTFVLDPDDDTEAAVPRSRRRVRVLRAAAAEFRDVDTRGLQYVPEIDAALDVVRVAGLGLIARVAPGGDAALWSPEGGGDGFAGALENVLRVMTGYGLLARGGLLVHSAGVLSAAGATIFLGASGAGKTTVARHAHAAGLAVTSDDLNAVVPLPDGGAQVLPVPFAGDFGRCGEAIAEPASLAGWVRLAQAADERSSPLPRSGVAAVLVANAPVVGRDPHRAAAVLAAASRLAAAAPGVELQLTVRRVPWAMLGLRV